MSAQIIKKDGTPEYAVVPITEYNELREKAALLDDTAAFDRAMKELADGDDELIPAEVAKRLLVCDDSPLKVWREFRGLTQDALGDAVGMSQPQIAALETGNRQGTVEVWKNLSAFLGLDIDDLV
jgi:DNA-binding XRE family transcriptional regulator